MRFTISLRLKTILGVAAIEAVLLAILLTLTLNYLKTTNFEGLDQRARSTASLFSSTIKNAVLSYDLATVDSFTLDLLSNKDILYVAVLGEGDVMLASQGDLPTDMTDEGLEVSSQYVQDGTFDVKANIEEAGINFGSVWIGFDMSRLNQQIEQAKRWSTFIVIGEMALVALFSYVLGAYLTRRLSILRRAADKIAQGERDVELAIKGSDELTSVYSAFVNMVNQLKRSEQKAQDYLHQLELANESLESKVEQRTIELLTSNKKLVAINEKLKSTQEKLVESEKLASIGTMAAGVAHEINNPMGAVSSNLQMFQSYLNTYQKWIELYQQHLGALDSESRKPLDLWQKQNHTEFLTEDADDCIKETERCIQRIKEIVNALQHYSATSIKQRSDFTAVELFDVISKAINQCGTPNTIKMTVAPSLAKQRAIKGVYSEILTLFTELIKNATQACNQQTINNRQDAELENTHSIEISATAASNFVMVQIIDSGCGLAEGAEKRIFDPFYTTLAVGEGMGLGLTYCYDIVRHHQGKIEVKNRTSGNRGVVVSVALPLIASSTVASNTMGSNRDNSTADTTPNT